MLNFGASKPRVKGGAGPPGPPPGSAPGKDKGRFLRAVFPLCTCKTSVKRIQGLFWERVQNEE